MGDRGVVAIVEKGGGELYLYTHWGATDLPKTVAQGIMAGGDRWTDESYLTRIIFDAMTKCGGGTTGFGISTWCPTDAWQTVTVDFRNGTVRVGSDDALTFDKYCDEYFG
jgi:hypothetical protein